MMNRMAGGSLPGICELACQLIGDARQRPVEAISMNRVGGGCISESYCLITREEKFFVKVNTSQVATHMFHCEAAGLDLLRSSRFRIPKTLGYRHLPDTSESGKHTAILVLEWLEPESPGKGFFEQMGRNLADMHMNIRKDHFGLDHDNFIGQSIQKNAPSKNWVEFWRTQRLGFQLELASRAGLLDQSERKKAEKLCDRLDRWLEEPDGGGSLLHGDLWQGNYLASDTSGESRQPALVDPAVYFGHREAEFGMIGLFGGFGAGFFDAYDEVSAPVDGFADRVEIYKLYHLLNHLNLFGTSYLSQCQQIIDRFID